MRTLLHAAGIAVLLGAVLYVLAVAVDKEELAECAKWQEQAREYVGWYSTNWQREQCRAHGIELPERYQN